MQPRNPYQGQPTSNMSFPTEAYMAAAANAARIQADAQAQMGKAIGQGIEKIGSAIGDYKKMSSEVKSSEKFFESMRDYLPSELTGGIDSIVGGEDYKHMSTAEKAEIWNNIKSYTGGAIAQRNKMEQIGAEQAGGMNRALVGVGPQYAQLEEQKRQRENEQKRYDAMNAKINSFKESINALRGSF